MRVLVDDDLVVAVQVAFDRVAVQLEPGFDVAQLLHPTSLDDIPGRLPGQGIDIDGVEVQVLVRACIQRTAVVDVVAQRAGDGLQVRSCTRVGHAIQHDLESLTVYGAL